MRYSDSGMKKCCKREGGYPTILAQLLMLLSAIKCFYTNTTKLIALLNQREKNQFFSSFISFKGLTIRTYLGHL